MQFTKRRTMLAAIALAGALLASVAAAKTTTLKLNSQWPATTAGSKVDQWFADEVKRRTNGEVEIRIFWSEALGKANENLSLMQKGAVEMGAMSPAYFPTQLPFHTAPNSIPMAMSSVAQANTLMKRLMKEVPAFGEEAKANGVRTLFFHHLNPYLLVSKDPLLTLDAVKGKKIRTWGTDMPRMAQAAGMTPVTLSLPEIYEGLGRGVIDAAPFSVDLVMNYKIYEVAKNVSEVTLWLGPSWGVWIAEGAWQKLTPEQQKVMLEVADEANGRDMQATIAAEGAAREELQKRGMKFHAFPAADAAKWKAALPDFFADFITTQEKAGKGDDARRMVKVWQDVVQTGK
ncbi:MAG: TRAP transporter substrate-binding protein DctP [Casimicrobiaceae bacterium]